MVHSFFDLKSYKEEIGKEYRRIIFFLCTQEDQKTAEKSKTFDHAETSSDTCEENTRHEIDLIMNDEELAKQLQSEFDIEVREEVVEFLDNSVAEHDNVNVQKTYKIINKMKYHCLEQSISSDKTMNQILQVSFALWPGK